jgi:hypothetical protein
MAIKTMSYLDIPVETRRSQAAAALTKLRSVLGDPTVSVEAKAEATAAASKVQKWASGTLT